MIAVSKKKYVLWERTLLMVTLLFCFGTSEMIAYLINIIAGPIPCSVEALFVAFIGIGGYAFFGILFGKDWLRHRDKRILKEHGIDPWEEDTEKGECQ